MLFPTEGDIATYLQQVGIKELAKLFKLVHKLRYPIMLVGIWKTDVWKSSIQVQPWGKWLTHDRHVWKF